MHEHAAAGVGAKHQRDFNIVAFQHLAPDFDADIDLRRLQTRAQALRRIGVLEREILEVLRHDIHGRGSAVRAAGEIAVFGFVSHQMGSCERPPLFGNLTGDSGRESKEKSARG